MRKLRNISVTLHTLIISALIFPVSLALADQGGFYQQTNLVSDTNGLAKTTDNDLVNPWGLAHSPTGPWWISDNNSGKASVYKANGISARNSISVPGPVGGSGAPTGNVFNSVSISDPGEFVISSGKKSGPSTFMFATEDGTIAGFNKNVDNTSALITVDRSSVTDSSGDVGAVYKGLAAGSSNNQDFIYATNFRFGTVEMFDSNFQLKKSFTDTQITNICPVSGQCYAPFGIKNISGKLYVTFALQQPGKHDDQSGAGNGFIDVFSTEGMLLNRLITGGHLNSPWGLALAPDNFGKFSNRLLVGNFGDGVINAYDTESGDFQGTLQDSSGQNIQNSGLWSIAFGNNGKAGKKNELFFTAGIGEENHGLFGKIQNRND